MPHEFKVGDHVEWNSEAGRVRGTIKKKNITRIKFKGYSVHASKEEPQYQIKSDKTDHMAMHKGSALKKLKKTTKRFCESITRVYLPSQVTRHAIDGSNRAIIQPTEKPLPKGSTGAKSCRTTLT